MQLGTVVGFIGNVLARWTNGKYESALHKVIAPKPGVHRYSIPFFNTGKYRSIRRINQLKLWIGNMNYLIETIPTCISDGEPERYAPITVREHLTPGW